VVATHGIHSGVEGFGVVVVLVAAVVAGMRTLTTNFNLGPPKVESVEWAEGEAPTTAPTPPSAPEVPHNDVDGPVYAATGQELESPSGKIKETVDGRYNMDISTYTDHQIATSLVVHARHILQPDNLSFAPFRDGGNRWWYDVVTTPPSEGHPQCPGPLRWDPR